MHVNRTHKEYLVYGTIASPIGSRLVKTKKKKINSNEIKFILICKINSNEILLDTNFISKNHLTQIY